MCGRSGHQRFAPRTPFWRSSGEPRPARGARARLSYLGSLVLVACATLACPQLMEDDFGVSDGGSGPAGGASALGGAGSGSEAGRAGADDGGNGGNGGTGSRPSGGAAGVSNGGTSGSVCSDTEFSAPTLVSELELEGNLWGPSLSSDGLTLYFAVESDSDPGDLYRAVRRDRASAFAAPTPITELNTDGAEGTPYATVYGVFFFSDRQGEPDIWRAVRALDGSFPAPELVPAVNSTEADFLPCLSWDGLRLLLGSYRGGAVGSSDLWVATRPTLTGSFAAPLPLSELNTGAREEGASLTEDDLQIYFTSDRAGGAGGLDIWQASRYNVQSGFSPPVNLTTVNGPDEDADVHVSRDGTEIFFSSSRSGRSRIWRAERGCP